MKVDVRAYGGYRLKNDSNKMILEFPGSEIRITELMKRVYAHVGQNEFQVSQDFLIVAIDGRAIADSEWDKTMIEDGQVCQIFTPLQGG